MKPLVTLLIGLGIGIAGATLFLQSMPPEEGSVEDRAEVAETELAKAQARIAEFEALPGNSRNRPGRSTADQARSIAEDILDGKKVDVDRVFQTAKPWMRDLAPVFDRIRVRDQKRLFDETAGELTRKYHLNDRQQRELLAYLEGQAEENSRRYSAVIDSDTSGFEDMIRASRDMGRPQNLDGFMERTLRGDDLTQYRNDRLIERADNVQTEADRKVTRLDDIVGLDEAQKDEVFVIMARGAQDYDPSMGIEGLSGDTSALVAGRSREDAIQAVLRPDQVTALEERRREQREDAERELNEIGLKLPDDWDFYDEDDL